MRAEDVESFSVQEIRSEYVRHFLSEEFVVGRDAEARLFKSIIDTITAEDVRQVAEQLRSSASCVVKAVSHRRCDPVAFAPAYLHAWAAPMSSRYRHCPRLKMCKRDSCCHGASAVDRSSALGWYKLNAANHTSHRRIRATLHLQASSAGACHPLSCVPCWLPVLNGYSSDCAGESLRRSWLQW